MKKMLKLQNRWGFRAKDKRMLCWFRKGVRLSTKKSDGVSYEKERPIWNRGLVGDEFLWRNENQSFIRVFWRIFIKVCVHQGSVLSPLLFAMVMNEVAENERNSLCSSGANGWNYGITERKLWRIEKGMKVNLGKIKLMVSGHW